MKKNLKYIFFAGFYLLIISTLFAQKRIDKWRTRFEKSNYLETETYAETVNYFQRLADNSPYAELFKFGVSPQGRDLVCLMAAKGKEFTPLEAKESGKPIILIENGIHSGEIEGKDACMLLMRDILISKTKENFLDSAIIMIVPIFNVDGHERRSRYNRINQNGPEEMGWRVTAQNLNLNRDFAKADTPEMKALLSLFSTWLPDFFIDTHTTDGADYQYTITYGLSTHKNIPAVSANWIEKDVIPFSEQYVNDKGFLISPYIGFVKGDVKNGIRDWIPGPRYSNGYANVQNRPGLLIETHMLKPYKDRVFATKALLEAIILASGNHASELIAINKGADKEVVKEYFENHKPYPLKFTVDMDSTTSSYDYKGIKFKDDSSKIAGGKIRKYTGEKFEIKVPYYNKDIITDSVVLPSAYFIPKEWKSIVDILKIHGVNVEIVNTPTKAVVQKYKFKNVKFRKFPYEGRFEPMFAYDTFLDTIDIPTGTYKVSTAQRTVGIIAHLLEPKGPDSFVNWGFFNAIFERKEYFEMYSMEPIAEKMYNASKSLQNEFNLKLKEDEKFKNNPRARLNFFYEKSPYVDQLHDIYPVTRLVKIISKD